MDLSTRLDYLAVSAIKLRTAAESARFQIVAGNVDNAAAFMADVVRLAEFMHRTLSGDFIPPIDPKTGTFRVPQ